MINSPKYKSIIREIRNLETSADRKVMNTTKMLNNKQRVERSMDMILLAEKKHVKLVNKLAKVAGGVVRLDDGVYIIDCTNYSIDTDITEFQRLYATMNGTIKWLMDDFRIALPRVDIELLGKYHNGFELRLGEFNVQCIHNPDPSRFIDFYLDGKAYRFFDLIDALQCEHRKAIEEIKKPSIISD
ncbi:hypothetical protein [Vibrio campbellii]|uniref:hypothetical protein n=1 Tax=Vibrio campbellii TaxID=680 RepID=UPI003F86C82E